ncbi:GlxA family transcriptional regulator [Fulvivirga ligni]|uniref:GlxA family transcriptional regulator n=1 Tax=Fulvivirga ligni TaxID=2904246 RepID=UPI001F20881E|nr:helix-turn-helix domain-containing protein [Fulvivirga ligni]UII20760.1 helix-turn-helix domain-containing protein [Fulvivirga ligni]
MKHISLIIPQGDTSFSNLEATFKMFTMTNAQLEREGKQPLFDLHLVGLTMESYASNGFFSVTPDVTIHEVRHTDMIIVPAIHGDVDEILKANADFIPWIKNHYENGSEVASLCIGAFLLAKTGVLKNKCCSTHWLMADEFRSRYPEVNLVDDKVITDEKGTYTSGGAYSSLNLNLYLIEKFAGREMAILSSKIFEIDFDRDSQAPFIIFKGLKEHSDDQVIKAQNHIEENYTEKMQVSDLADMVGVGRRSFERRFKKATGNTVVEYMQRVKVEAAKKELESSRKTINEVMYDVGYNDTKAFREVFRRFTGVTPLGYKNKYNKELVVA